MRDHIFVTVYKPIAGWKAILMSDLEGPLQTGYFAFRTKSEAVRDAKDWAKAENLTFKYFKDKCPYDEPLHNHHDGCPSCYLADKELNNES